MFTNQDNFYRHQYDDSSLDSLSTLIDNRIKASIESNEMGSIDPQVELLFGQPKEDMNVYDVITRSFYFSSEGLVPAGSADEAPIVHGNFSADTKKVSGRGVHGRVLFSRTELKYEDSRVAAFAKVDSVIIGSIRKFYQSISQLCADFFNRGWETSYTDAFGENMNARDMSGTNPLFAYNHKVAGGTHTVSNLCIRENSNGSFTLNPVLSDTAILDTVQYSKRVRDHMGIPYGSTRNLDTIICSERQARNLLVWSQSQFVPHSANNDINIFPLILPNIKVMSWDKLSVDGQGNFVNPTTNAKYVDQWFLVDSNKVKNDFVLQFLSLPEIIKEPLVGNSENVAYYTRPEFRVYFKGVSSVFGSNSTEIAAPADFPKI